MRSIVKDIEKTNIISVELTQAVKATDMVS